MPKDTSFIDNKLIEAVKSSYSVREVLKKLDLVPTGGNYKSFYHRVRRLNLDISHFTGQGHLSGKSHSWSLKIPLENILVENSTYTNNHDLKKRLLETNLVQYKCSICNISDWLGKNISLHLDHINGTNNDHRLENLRLLCPNCHSQTDTFAGKNKKKKEKKNKEKLESKKQENICCDCQKIISVKSVRCKSCNGKANAPTKIEWPTNEELHRLLETNSYVTIGKMLGVSDNSIRKRLKR